MKTLPPWLVATGIAAVIAGVMAAIPTLFEPVIVAWVVFMLLIIAAFEYRPSRRGPSRH